MKIFQGTIITCDWEGSVVNYLVEDQGKIVYTGNQLPEAYTGLDEGAEYIDLGDRALLPAFGDGHIHFSSWALFNSTFDVRSASSLEEMGKIIKLYAHSDPKAKVILGFGLTPHFLEEKRLIKRSELDAIIKDRPVVLVCCDGHAAVANTRAIGLLPYRVRGLNGFDLETGLIANEAFLEASNYIISQVPVTRLLSAMLEAMDELAGYGVGLVHTTEGVGYPRDMDVDLVRFITRGSPIQFRTYLQTMDLQKIRKRRLPRVGGCFDCALDGSFGTRDAALMEPYSDDQNNRGILFYSDEEVMAFVKAAHLEDLQVQLHCAGDAAVAQALKAFEAALAEYPREDHRHMLIHAPLIRERDLGKIAELGLGITIQPAFFYSRHEPPGYIYQLLGERAEQIWPLKKLLSMGINISGGSDAPVMDPDPVAGIYGACNHPVAGCSAELEDALSMFTYNIAHTSFDENERGSLEMGKKADMVILNRNPFELEPRHLRDLKALKCYLSGEEYTQGKTTTSAVIDSIKSRFRAG